MTRAIPIVERELRKFVRTPALLIMTLIMPVLNLVVLGPLSRSVLVLDRERHVAAELDHVRFTD